ncbi:DUF4169 family protein [Lutibaculum baratangense]|uniref:DUF4169 family protein n=1 Tax=Lutibaculum baratangense AMV1 TaxID=631454 RepID=V4R5S5_9HYPH|nr:DUF4169 family protein [Lutibaculum baratangense]ESR27307.1 hypothetical protein N177_0286 [Lutibaculum baratangense AMV1]
MSDIVNLRQARKARARAEKEKQAADNRLRFGMTKAERQAAERQRSSLDRHVEGHRLGRTDDDE